MVKGINNFMEEDPNEQLGKLIYSGYFLTKQKGRSMTQYYSKSKDEYVNINDMHHQHVWYAFKKLCDRLEGLALTQTIWDDAFNPAEDIKVNVHERTKTYKMDYVRRDVYELLFDRCELLEKNANSKSVFKLEKALSEEKSTSQNLFNTVKGLREQIKRMYAEQSHSSPRYHFSEIPNDYEGRDLVKQLKRYLNTDRYSMRVRGQYLDKSKLGKNESWRNYDDGQPLNKSKCIRVYIDQKKERV